MKKGSLLKRIFDQKLLKNKLYGTALIGIGYLTMRLLNDGTVFLFTLMFGLPVLFAKKNVID